MSSFFLFLPLEKLAWEPPCQNKSYFYGKWAEMGKCDECACVKVCCMYVCTCIYTHTEGCLAIKFCEKKFLIPLFCFYLLFLFLVKVFPLEQFPICRGA